MRPLILFAHGAGVSSASPWMMAWARRLGEIGDVGSFDYTYMRQGRRAPDRMPKLILAHRAALAALRAKHGSDRPVFLAGKSMGSRVGCHVATGEGAPADDADTAAIAGVICFGYPLVGMSGAVRDDVLRALRTPIIFLQGTRDRLCPLDRLAAVRAAMKAPNDLHVVEGGDHSLTIPRRGAGAAGRTQTDADGQTLAAVREFVDRHAGTAP